MTNDQLKMANKLSDKIYELEKAIKSLKEDTSISIGIFSASGYINHIVHEYLLSNLNELKQQFDEL